MVRPPRLSLPSYPHHVIQGGPIFFALNDCEVCLDRVREAKRKREVGIGVQFVAPRQGRVEGVMPSGEHL